MEEQVGTYKKLPFIGQTYLYKDTDPTRNKPKRDSESHVQVFCSNKPEDREALAQIYTKARKNQVYIEDLDKKCMEKNDACVWYTYIVWTDKFYTNPNKKQNRDE